MYLSDGKVSGSTPDEITNIKSTTMLREFKSLVDLQQAFPDDKSARAYLKLVLWDGEPQGCPHCGSTHLYAYADQHNYRCNDCNRQFNVLNGTIFENSKVSLVKWFIAIYLASVSKRGVSSYQLAKTIGVTQKTAWFMLHRLRGVFSTLEAGQLHGVTYADETVIGGKYKNKHKDKRKPGAQGRSLIDKVLVFGVMQQKGMIRTKVLPDAKIETIVPALHGFVKQGSTVFTDELPAYNHLGSAYTHDAVDHGRKQYVNENGATTNPIENAWSHLKRTIIGTHYHISPKHTHRYLWEFEYKFNSRTVIERTRFSAVIQAIEGTRLRYHELIAK